MAKLTEHTDLFVAFVLFVDCAVLALSFETPNVAQLARSKGL
ncbi:MAG: hypothetical protein ACXW03_08790 [Methylobacter sp.]|jgi:hypothetical protein